MANKKTEVQSPIDTPEIVRSADYRSLYVNNIQIQVSQLDFRIILGEAANDENRLKIEQKLSVVMSPQEAKVLAILLGSNVEKYEKINGIIALAEPDSSR